MIRKVLFLILLYSMAFSCKNNKPEEMKIEENTGINNMVTALSYLDETNPKYHELEFIREENYFNTENSSSARNFYSKAMEFYNKMEYEKSIDTFILTCKDYTFPIIYYHLGLCLMDAGSYDPARNAFEKSITLAPRYYYYDRDYYGGKMDSGKDLYTRDNNGIMREGYFFIIIFPA